jgi:hypothetical protein
MYTVGLDVDTINVSLKWVTFLIIIWLFAGNFIKKQSPPVEYFKSAVGKIFSFNLVYCLLKKKLFRLNDKQSADNSLVLLENSNDQVVFHIKSFCASCEENFISDDLKISDHLKKHKKAETSEQLGYYLAGLIEANGHIGSGEINIAFNKIDVSLAYFIKKKLGYGSVWYNKQTNVCYYGVFKKQGRKKLFNLINGKLRGPFKIELLKKHNYDKEFNLAILPPVDFDLSSNHWLAGFSEKDASFRISLFYSKSHKNLLKLKLTFAISQKYPDLLNQIKQCFGGSLLKSKTRETRDCFEYSTNSLENAYKVISYFDIYHLNSTKYINYLK